MIPKIIHYCWFGGNPLPKSARKCIESWKKFFPDFEIREWNESNYDVKKIPYVAEAYEAKKYAFVSDYARFDILCQYGGVYFDTDVEVIRPFDDILERGAFMGCETDGEDVNPGLGIAAPPGLGIYREILDYYATQHFQDADGSLNTETVVTKTTRILKEHGWQNGPGIQRVSEISVYPKAYFNPMDNNTGKMRITEQTHSIHWYSMSWMPKRQVLIRGVTRVFHRLFGVDCFRFLKKNG
ncbi:MAG: glycosyl transferase [Clostridia bacterium]|nr:glycosyl transferase [Clostridia bacterium]